MKCSDPHLFTPLYLKLDSSMPWPEEELAFYLLTSDGLFLCRNHPLFQSCVRTHGFPSELAPQRPFLRLKYPRIPGLVLERVVGFFELVARRHHSEAAVLLVWNRETGAMEIVVPKQTGIVSSGTYGSVYPIELEYEVPALPPHLLLIGDIHSHVDYAAYASGTDQLDEKHRPGLHLVVGRLSQEPPEFHCEVIADGTRFKVRDLGMVVEGYQERREDQVPPEWLDKLTVQPLGYSKLKHYSTGSGNLLANADEDYEIQSMDAVSHPSAMPEGGRLDKETEPAGGHAQPNSQVTVRKPSRRT
jgi:PRTRC genetic system protein A